jgi:hypothetical protein
VSWEGWAALAALTAASVGAAFTWRFARRLLGQLEQIRRLLGGHGTEDGEHDPDRRGRRERDDERDD